MFYHMVPKVGFHLFQGVPLHQADILSGDKRNNRLSFPSVPAHRGMKSLHQTSSPPRRQMFLQRGFCTSLWAMNRLSVCHDNRLPITKAVRLSKAIKWWNKIVCSGISKCVSAHICCGWAHGKMVMFIEEHDYQGFISILVLLKTNCAEFLYFSVVCFLFLL